jgi:gluconokinase
VGYIIGVDIGTSSTKAVLFDTDAQQIGSSAQRYTLRFSSEAVTPTRGPGAAEQDASEILQATMATVAEVIAASGIEPSELLGLSFSCAMHTLLLVDEVGEAITPIYTWADNRSDRAATFVQQQDSGLYQRTGIPPHPMSPLVKLVWLRKEQPAVFAKAARVVSVKEYVLNHWCGEWVVDVSIATTTGLLNLAELNWDAGALALAGIEPHQLSQIVPTTHTLVIKGAIAQEIGVRANTPVIVGASDGVLANLGIGAISADIAAITLGTSGAVRRVVDRPITNSAAQLFCYALTPDRWVMGGAVNNGGIALQWTRDTLVPYSPSSPYKHREHRQYAGASGALEPTASTYEHLTQMAKTTAPGAEGLIFHPFLLGERAPLWDAQARASFFGIGRNHTQAHFVRAVMEGVLYNLHSVFSALITTGGDVQTLRASGGFAHAEVWQQMLADIFNRPIEIPMVIESSALGAAVLGLVALGEWADIEGVSDRIKIAQTRTPIADNARRYQKLLPIYTDLLTGFTAQYAALQQALEED